MNQFNSEHCKLCDYTTYEELSSSENITVYSPSKSFYLYNALSKIEASDLINNDDSLMKVH